ncbi:mitochondrial splicing system protein [Cadophora gregata]|uniref:mitochondrial splicing system protein n=1 Tax=Cadophora gregata TaxID=51156 RepID=UPI0026DB2C74|nr:mitochondrial splicing system protein [Cadophora gregata]KAK0121578.1 mitochondrial splicing system protein [Cadophora gregata]
MIQHATATARLCARRAFSPIWHMPLAILNRPALMARNHGQHPPVANNIHTCFSQQRSFSKSINRHNNTAEGTVVSANQEKYAKTEEEEMVTATYRMPEWNPVTDNETIYAISTGPDASAIAVIRISGPACTQIYQALCPGRKLPPKRYAAVRTLYHPNDRTNIIDSDAVVIQFGAPNTATGEDMLELHTHGGIATVTAVLSAIGQVNPKLIRAASPGEFTRRAFANDKLDLEQIESLGDILTAETELQRRASLRGPYQQLGRIYDSWRTSLIEELAHAAADTDHSEEHNLDDMAGIWPRITEKVRTIQEEISYHQMGAKCGQLLRQGIQVSLIGLPNAGKSSLFNQIVGSEASIVSQQAGTTRDVVEKTINYRDYLCTFADTAGVRAADVVGGSDIGAIEEEGIKRAIAKAKDADVLVYVTSFEPDPLEPSGYKTPIMDNLSSIIRNEHGSTKEVLIVVNKNDRPTPGQIKSCLSNLQKAIGDLLFNPGTLNYKLPIVDISVADAVADRPGRYGQPGRGNIGGFTRALMNLFENMTTMPVDMAHLIGIRERQSQLLTSCSGHLNDFMNEAAQGVPDNSIATHHLELAAKCLAQITGRLEGAGDVEEILGVVFSK